MFSEETQMTARNKKKSFRVGKVAAYLRGEVWYLNYTEHGQRRRPRVGTDRNAARQLAAQINAQLETGESTVLSFEPISIAELQSRWLEHYDSVLRTSVNTISRYRAATNHLIRFVKSSPVGRTTAQFRVGHAEEFVRHIRTIRVSPNGHPNARLRPLLDKGVLYILFVCRTMFNYATKRRHLPPYAENPFGALEFDRMPIENAKPIVLFTPDQERAFLEACDDWQFPIFLTLMLTGLRPGELTHLLLPDDLDLEDRLLRIQNKPGLGWCAGPPILCC